MPCFLRGPLDDVTLRYEPPLSNATTRISFVPSVEGQYVISVLSDGQFVGGIVSVNVVGLDMSTAFSAAKSYATGAGLVRASIGVPARFIIQAKKKNCFVLVVLCDSIHVLFFSFQKIIGC